ncbi:MAG: sulfatase-like hydrolase/transferase [Chloroflexi bacterium]|nr:sulfatase-like hydrolase/transferase [Chloroflexota bacterium]
MTLKKTFWDRAILHPFLFAVYPLFSLWLANIDQVAPFALSRALFLTIILLALLLPAGLILYRNPVKGAVFASLLLLLFLLYGRFFAIVDMKSILGFVIGRHRFMLPLWGIAAAAGGLLLWRAKTPYSLNRILNIVSVFLLAVVLIQIGAYTVQTGFTTTKVSASPTGKESPAPTASDEAGPDVYYILLDGYSRKDVLLQENGPDVSDFLERLTNLGFVLGSCSQSNYDYTSLSLSSSLNMDYLDAFGIEMDPNEPRIKYADFEDLTRHSTVRKKFESYGYQTIAFKSVYPWLDVTDADIFYDAEEDVPFYNRLEAVNFQYLFLSTTIFRPLLEAQTASPKIVERLPLFVTQLFFPKADLLSSREYKQYQQNLYALEKLSEVPRLPGKKFVYAHLFHTHQPYVFNPDGSFRWPPKDSKEAYFDQVLYTNERIIEVIETILRESKTPPVIILQSDHGYPYTTDRVKILNAYYFPGAGGDAVYPTISPVNSFRLIFNAYFNENMPLLEDLSYHSSHDRPYQMELVPTSCP